jgi:metallo-beta-lactamase family protein
MNKLSELPRKSKIEFEKYGVKISLEYFWWVWNKEKWVSLTGSATLLTVDIPGEKPLKWLIDFWMFQWCENELKYNEILPFDLSKIDFVIVTHSHIDHIWKLLHFSKDEFDGTIRTTKVARGFIWTMLKDVIKLQPKPEKTKVDKLMDKLKNLYDQYRKLDNLGREQIELLIEDLQEEIDKLESNQNYLEEKDRKYFTWEDLSKLFYKINTIDFYEKAEIKNNISLSFIKAGHLPWSAQAIIKIKVWTNKYITLGFSWDLWKYRNPSIWWKPDISKEKLDLYMIESTYAWRTHAEFKNEEEKLVKAINDTIKNKWKIIIPVFIQWRAQELIHLLHNLIKTWRIQRVPIYYYSSWMEEITNLCKKYYPHIFKDELNWNLFSPAIIWKWKKRKDQFRSAKNSAILLVSGGMMDGGTVREYLDLLSDPKNLFVSMGYQWEWTLWRKIFMEKIKEVVLPSIWKIKINAKIHNFRGFSWHADEHDLLEIIKNMKFTKWAKIIINHGEKSLEQLTFGWAVKWIVWDTKQVLFAEFNEKPYESDKNRK